jgi:hypothetical protein
LSYSGNPQRKRRRIDINGDGTTGDLLPGTTAYASNRGMGRAQMERLVAQFNPTYAGAKDSLKPHNSAHKSSGPLCVWRP